MHIFLGVHVGTEDHGAPSPRRSRPNARTSSDGLAVQQRRFGFAPPARSLVTRAAWRFMHARYSGVTPVSLAVFTRAPAPNGIGRVQIIEVHGPVQRRGAVTLRGVDVDMFLQERTATRGPRRTAIISASAASAMPAAVKPFTTENSLGKHAEENKESSVVRDVAGCAHLRRRQDAIVEFARAVTSRSTARRTCRAA